MVRAWLEQASETTFRARITQTLDISEHDEIVVVVTTSDDVCDAVRVWLDAFVEG